tara:strand:- start:845 stop:1153 length:309 start_codon:yes stop_codon:yes gene_type:complete
MATLKSQKMVRGRDLKTPLATSTMDKKSNGKKGGPGDGKKKKAKKPEWTYVRTSSGTLKKFKPGQFEGMRGFDRSIDSKLIKKTKRGDGAIQYTYTRNPKKN